MNIADLIWGLLSFFIAVGLGIGVEAAGADRTPGPTDWSDWEKYRESVVHPATIIKPKDVVRAKANIRRYPWARSHANRLRRSADVALKILSPEYLEQMIEPTTPGCTGPCPACRVQGRPWHPNGQWRWSASRPNQLACSVCKTIFPNDEFPESVIRRSTGEREYSVFVTVFAGNPSDMRLVESTRLLTCRGDAPDAVALEIKTTEGTDLVVSQLELSPLHVAFGSDGVTTDGRLTAIVSRGDSSSQVCFLEGTQLEARGVELDLPVACFRGEILDVLSDRGHSCFVVEADLPEGSDLTGHTLFAIDDGFRRAYPIVAIEEVEGRLRVFTKRNGRGFEARPAQRWELPVTVQQEYPQ